MVTPDPDASTQSQRGESRFYFKYPMGPVADNEDIDLRIIWSALIRDRWIVLALTLAGLMGAGAYALIAQSWYRAEVRLLPADADGKSSLGSQLSPLGGLAGMVGVTIGANTKNEPLAILGSRDFARSFIVENGLVEIISRISDEEPSLESAVEYFEDKIRSVREDQKTGIVSLDIKWIDAETAAEIANRMAARINKLSRDNAISEATASIEYLRGQIGDTQEVSLRQAISRLLEGELQKLLVAKGRDEFAFRIIDSAHPPVHRYWPRRGLLLGAGIASGLVFSFLIIFVRSVARRTGD